MPDFDETPLAYDVIEHDGGWAYRSGVTLSETYPTREAAMAAARDAAERQQVAAEVEGETPPGVPTDLFKA